MRKRGISKDARGNEVHQVVNATDGTLTSVTDSNGQTVNYTYDESKRVTGVETTADGKTYRNAYTYENDRIKTVAHNTTGDTPDVTYTFNYDELGRKTAVKVGNQALSTNVYSPDRKSRLEEVQYGNGGKVKYTYDDFDRVTGVGYDNDESPRFTYEYDSKGRAAFVKDATDGGTIRTGYDQTDRPNETEHRDGEGSLKYRTLIEYDKKNRVKAFNEATADQSFKTEYTYDADNRVTKVCYNGSDTSKVDYVYDKLNRITSRTVTNGTSAYATQYAYVPGATAYGENATTPLVSSITQGEGENAMNFAYTYDNCSNITSETRNGLATTYVYDALSQLIRVNDPHENATWVYTYDRGGNILNKAKYAYTTEGELGEVVESIPYTYGIVNWKDKLTIYNGETIIYDAIGNPINDGTWTYIWAGGRRLKQMSKSGTIIQFKYDHNGLRVGKIVNGIETRYTLQGKLVMDVTNGNDKLHFFYDAQNRPAKVSFNGVMYTYVHNLRGDVVGIIDNSNMVVVEYQYDAWGKLLSTAGSLASTLGKKNPFRYRSYVYDEESGMYYLRMRYYHPEYCRFLTADQQIEARSLYTYCSNSPVVYGDWSGREEEESESSGDITNFMRDGFGYQMIHVDRHYNPDTCRDEERSILIMRIPYQHIQYYNNALLFYDRDAINVATDKIMGEIKNAGIDKSIDIIGKVSNFGVLLSVLFSILGIAESYEQAMIEKERSNMHQAAQQAATDKKTGIIVVVNELKTWSWVYDPIMRGRGTYYGPKTSVDVKYYEETEYFKNRNFGRSK